MLGVDIPIILAYVVGVILLYVIARIFLLPFRLVIKLIYNGVVGGIMLWLFNLVGSHLGFVLPINPITALVAGFLGLPGVVLMILYYWLGR